MQCANHTLQIWSDWILSGTLCGNMSFIQRMRKFREPSIMPKVTHTASKWWCWVLNPISEKPVHKTFLYSGLKSVKTFISFSFLWRLVRLIFPYSYKPVVFSVCHVRMSFAHLSFRVSSHHVFAQTHSVLITYLTLLLWPYFRQQAKFIFPTYRILYLTMF